MTLRAALLALGATALFATPAAAHRQWMMPSATVLSGDDVWVTVDAAVSNDLFYFEHQPLRAQPLAMAPDGSAGKIENWATGRYRSTFDVHLTARGTWKIMSVNDSVFGSYRLNGVETRLPRGLSPDRLAEAIPAGATDVRTSHNVSRNEIFVTAGEPTTGVFTPTGKGIELVPVTHPNDLVAGETASFRFLLDGKPAAGLPVTIIPGGNRYRDTLNQIDLKTGPDGGIAVRWPGPGMYWLNVTTEAGSEQAMPARRASYVTTLEVLAP
jgi:hypothetical protein